MKQCKFCQKKLVEGVGIPYGKDWVCNKTCRDELDRVNNLVVEWIIAKRTLKCAESEVEYVRQKVQKKLCEIYDYDHLLFSGDRDCKKSPVDHCVFYKGTCIFCS